MSTFRCEIVPIKLEPHPNADSLSLCRIWGYTVVVKTSDWTNQDRGVYIPPDSVVPLCDRFAFLFKQEQIDKWKEFRYSNEQRPTTRITVKRFRGIYSQGLLMPIDDGKREIGEDVAEAWGITHFEPIIKFGTNGDNVPGPSGLIAPKYDVESFNRYGYCIPEGTPVYVTEKIHGSSSRHVFHNGIMYCGSRSNWRAYSDKDLWHQVLKQNGWVEDWCLAHPGLILFSEIFGQVQDLQYGAKKGQLFLRVFDVMDNGRWVNYCELEELVAPENRAPVIFIGPFEEKLVRELAEGNSHICPDQLSEGVVICPLVEMTHPEIGRVQFKIVSNRYLERKNHDRLLVKIYGGMFL